MSLLQNVTNISQLQNDQNYITNLKYKCYELSSVKYQQYNKLLIDGLGETKLIGSLVASHTAYCSGSQIIKDHVVNIYHTIASSTLLLRICMRINVD